MKILDPKKNIQEFNDDSIKIQELQIDSIEEVEELEDELIVKVIASDNLVNRSFIAWDVEVLQQMVNDAWSISVILNHDWNDVWCSVGYVVDAKLNVFDSIPTNYKQLVKMEEFNKQIVDRDGFNQVEMMVKIGRNEKEIINKIKDKSIKNVSTGGWMLQSDLICPICSETHGRKVSFWELDKMDNYICPHYIPSGWGNMFNSDEPEAYAPYAILDGIYDSCELSLVNIPNLPGTGLQVIEE